MAEPRYRRIAEDLRRQIEDKELRPGDRLPTEFELMASHEASRNTVRDAIKMLAALGLIETRPGQGAYVIERMKPFLTTLSGDPLTSGGGRRGIDLHGGGQGVWPHANHEQAAG